MTERIYEEQEFMTIEEKRFARYSKPTAESFDDNTDYCDQEEMEF